MDDEKLALVFSALKEVDWSLGHFLYHAFRRPDSGDQSRSRTLYADKFLEGRGTRGVGKIIKLWMQASKRTVSDSTETDFSLTTPYPKIMTARPALTSFAAQTTQDELDREAKHAVNTTSGLASVKPTKNQRIRKILQENKPLTLEYLTTIASGRPRQNGVLQIRKTRPIDAAGTYDSDVAYGLTYTIYYDVLSSTPSVRRRLQNRLPQLSSRLFPASTLAGRPFAPSLSPNWDGPSP
ncbi:hypothetical protein OG21DRAFT_1604470 [Imleria badia]|nr:hypothetical protein OG21DRAFT_1604470 [Imleria badia]